MITCKVPTLNIYGSSHSHIQHSHPIHDTPTLTPTRDHAHVRIRHVRSSSPRRESRFSLADLDAQHFEEVRQRFLRLSQRESDSSPQPQVLSTALRLVARIAMFHTHAMFAMLCVKNPT